MKSVYTYYQYWFRFDLNPEPDIDFDINFYGNTSIITIIYDQTGTDMQASFLRFIYIYLFDLIFNLFERF